MLISATDMVEIMNNDSKIGLEKKGSRKMQCVFDGEVTYVSNHFIFIFLD